MENFFVCSIYFLAMTQKSEIIVACHKTPNGQMYCTDVAFITAKIMPTTILIPNRSQ